MSKVQKPLKYAGGKTGKVSDIVKVLFDNSGKTRFVEPFVGGLGMTMTVMPKEAILNDFNPYVINLYQCIQRGLSCGDMEMKNDQEFYYQMREKFNAGAEEYLEYGDFTSITPEDMALIFYYMNRTGYNGLCRFNKSGRFNVPYGHRKSTEYVANFDNLTPILEDWEFSTGDFSNLGLKISNSTDFIYCLTPETLVRMEDESLKRIDEVCVQDKVFGGKTVQKTMNRNHTGNILNIKISSLMDDMRVTPEHRVLRIPKNSGSVYADRQENRTDDVLWNSREVVQASELKKGDYFLIPTGGLEKEVNFVFENLRFCRKDICFKPCKELFRLLGYYAAEGHIQYSSNGVPQSVVFSFGNEKKQNQLEDCLKCIRECFDIDARVYRNCPHDTVDQIHIGSHSIADFFIKYCSGKALTKQLHSDLMTAPISLQKELFTTWINSDGGFFVSKNSSYKLTGTSSSINMIRQMFQIALRMELKPSIKKRHNSKGNDTYDVYFASEDAVKLGYTVESPRFCSQRRIINNHILVRIREINSELYNGLVYDIDVDGDDLFSAPYALTHNCDPPYDTPFTAYSAGGFDFSDQVRLVDFLADYTCPVVISNQATDRMLELYKNAGYEIQILDVARRISCNGDRTPAKEILATRNV